MTHTRLARRKGFQAMHRYEVEGWTAERNEDTFGACFTPHGHGHNYELEAYFEGPIDPTTGMIVNLAEVDKLMGEVTSLVDHRHLNFETEEFKKKVPTTEALAQYLYENLNIRLKFQNVHLVKVRLFECEDLWVDVWPE